MNTQGLLRHQSAASSASSKRQDSTTSRVWEFPHDARTQDWPCSEDQKLWFQPRESSKPLLTKISRSLPWSPRGQDQKRIEGTQCGGVSDHSGTFTALGFTVEKGWIQVCRCIFQRCSDALDLELKEGERACERGIRLPQKCGATCRSWPTYPSRVIRYVQKVHCGRGKALYATAGGRCARSSCPPPGA